MQTESYIWGYITGIGTILMGLLWVPLVLNGMAFGAWMEGSDWYRENAPSAVIEAAVIAIILTGIGFLVIFKKALGWYLIWLILAVLGVICFLTFVGFASSYYAGNDVDSRLLNDAPEVYLMFIHQFLLLSVFFLTLLWIQVRYWRKRRALI